MLLKDAVRVRDIISNILNSQNHGKGYYREESDTFLSHDRFAKTTLTHLYSNASLGEDVVESVPVDSKYLVNGKEVDFRTCCEFLMSLVDELEKLLIAIEKAKNKYKQRVDALEKANDYRKHLANVLSKLPKNESSIDYATVCRKLKNGKSESFRYEVKKNVSFDIDSQDRIEFIKKLNNDINERELLIETSLDEVEVDYVCKYDYDCEIDELFEQFLNACSQ